MSPRQRFRVDAFCRVLDDLETFVGDRLRAYQQLAKVWAFPRNLPSSTDNELGEAASTLLATYPNDFSDRSPTLGDELIDFRDFLPFVAERKNAKERKDAKQTIEQFMYDQLLAHDLSDTFPNVQNMLCIFLTKMVSNAGCERSFSTLKRVKATLVHPWDRKDWLGWLECR
eukprot:GHVU01196001.1.p1 GENE.GHVU01196001.1~~GHVU01196001.1.p1  ORF type:complete len:171 (+),score=17.75 GHVU01196001.1:332-844(+)